MASPGGPLVTFVFCVLRIVGFLGFMCWSGQMPAALRAGVITKVADSSSKIHGNLPQGLTYLNVSTARGSARGRHRRGCAPKQPLMTC